MPLPTSHFYITPDDEPDPAITLPLSAAIKLFKLFLAYGIFLCLFARRASLSAAIALYLIALSLWCGIEVFGPFGVDAATASPTDTATATTITPISGFDTCPDNQPMTASTHALDNAVQVLEFAFLTFVVLGLLVRYASIGALVGLSLIVGGVLYDFGIGLHGVDAAAATATEPAGECVASGRTRYTTTLLALSVACVVLVLALVAGHLHRCLPESKNTTSGNNKTPLIRSELAGALLLLTLLAVLIPMAFAADPTSNFKLTKRSAAAAPGGGDLSPIWITYYSTTTTWLPAVTVTAPPILGSWAMPTPTKSTDFVVTETDWVGSSPTSGISGHICTEFEQAVCPIVEGRKTAAAAG
jgi:hypothetical protein